MNLQQQRQNYVSSLEQLTTASSILAGFAFSGLLALPSISDALFGKIVQLFQGDFERTFQVSFYALFFSTLCFLSTLIIIMVYKISNYMIPVKKLKRIHTVSNFTFSIALAFLMISVICFAVPSLYGLGMALFMGIAISSNFLWENMLPSQRKRREEQVRAELEQEQAEPAQAEAEQTSTTTETP